VIAFGTEVFGQGTALLSFLDRPAVRRDQVILPTEVLDGIEEQVLGVARHAGRLLASGQHLKRGVLLHGAPGTGKTHTIGYLLGQLPGVTVVVLSGTVLKLIADACSIARTLQPSVIVVEDVDLIAEEREAGSIGAHPLLFQLLNEMDGLGADLDVTFLLTTNRADLLEPALAQRPGRVDHAARLPLPDAAARRRLLRLYQGNLELDLADPEAVIARTEGVTASFIKELLRRAALRSAQDAPAASEGDDSAPLRLTDAHMSAALGQLLDTRNQLTRVLLGAQRDPAPVPSNEPAL
jgi:ATP-dependent 26S proteasome regulatory subunit